MEKIAEEGNLNENQGQKGQSAIGKEDGVTRKREGGRKISSSSCRSNTED